MQLVHGNANMQFSMVWNVSRLSTFPPLPCLLPTFSLAPSVLEIDNELSWNSRMFMLEIKNYLSAVSLPCEKHRNLPSPSLIFQIYVSRGLSWSLEPLLATTDASAQCLTVSTISGDKREAILVNKGFPFSVSVSLLQFRTRIIRLKSLNALSQNLEVVEWGHIEMAKNKVF